MQEWQRKINEGAGSFQSGDYAAAISSFREAVALNANDSVPHLYLAVGLNQQFTPEGIPPLHPEMGKEAEREFARALELDSMSWPALVLMGQLMSKQSRFEEARSLFTRALDLDPMNADIWCTLGGIGWRQSRQHEAAKKNLIEEAASNLKQALTLDPGHTRAMSWMSTLLREKGDRDSLSAADDWLTLAESAREEQRRLGAAGVFRAWPPELAGTFRIVREFAWLAAQSFPPPPPPPPPPLLRRTSERGRINAAPPGWTFRRRADDERSPTSILVDPGVQERKLVKRIDPISATRGGDVRLRIVIAEDGHVKSAKFIEGDTAVADAAIAAVRQWVYRPTISNWQPVEVVSEARIR